MKAKQNKLNCQHLKHDKATHLSCLTLFDIYSLANLCHKTYNECRQSHYASLTDLKFITQIEAAPIFRKNIRLRKRRKKTIERKTKRKAGAKPIYIKWKTLQMAEME